METTTETISVNGTALNTLAKNIESLTGRLRAPGHRTANLALPGMHGELWIPNKKYNANTIVLPMWVVGCDDDGSIPNGSNARREFFANVEALVGLFKSTGQLLDVRWTKADGQVRQCWAESTDTFDFTTDPSPLGRVGVILTIPGAFWQDTADLTQIFNGPATGGVKPTKFAGSTAPMEDLVYTFVGPRTNPGITFQDGSFFRYQAALAAGQQLVVDSGEWTLTGTGFVPDYAKLVHDGEDGIWGALPPMPGAAQTINLDGTATTAASSVTLKGRRKFLIG